MERQIRAIEDHPHAAQAFRQLAEAHWSAGDRAGFAEFFRRAYLLGHKEIPAEANSGDRTQNEVRVLRDRATALIEHGVGYSRVIASLALAEAQLGNAEAVRHLVDYEKFFRHDTVAPPDGMGQQAFNAALAAEIKSDLRYYESPETRAIRNGWRMNGLHRDDCPMLQRLMALLRGHAERYIADLPWGAAHPFLAARPPRYEIDGWAVVSNAESFHQAHIHPDAWATGVYYVAEPEISRASGSHTGWLRVGPPHMVPEAMRPYWGERLVPPAAGSFVIMPGYFFHETLPMGVDQERICIAFEIEPPELRFPHDGDDGTERVTMAPARA